MKNASEIVEASSQWMWSHTTPTCNCSRGNGKGLGIVRHEINKFSRGKQITLESGLQEAGREVRYYQTDYGEVRPPGV